MDHTFSNRSTVQTSKQNKINRTRGHAPRAFLCPYEPVHAARIENAIQARHGRDSYIIISIPGVTALVYNHYIAL